MFSPDQERAQAQAQVLQNEQLEEQKTILWRHSSFEYWHARSGNNKRYIFNKPSVKTVPRDNPTMQQ